MWTIGSLSLIGEVCEELQMRLFGACCFQEVRWGGQDSWMLVIAGMICML